MLAIPWFDSVLGIFSTTDWVNAFVGLFISSADGVKNRVSRHREGDGDELPDSERASRCSSRDDELSDNQAATSSHSDITASADRPFAGKYSDDSARAASTQAFGSDQPPPKAAAFLTSSRDILGECKPKKRQAPDMVFI